MSDGSNSKGTSVELRIILIGDKDVGKKSIINRIKLINSTETKKNNFKGFMPPKKKKNKMKQVKNDSNDNTTRSKKTGTYESVESTEEETEEDKLREHKEEKRINCMRFSKLYKLGFNSIDISFFPCAEEQPISYDYELKEDDEFYEFEKEYRVSIKQLVKELEYIIVKPAEDERNQVEFLFVLCFDLGNISSFEKLVVFFSQIERHFKLTSDYKIVLVGNKLDKRASTTDDEKDNIEQFKSKYSSNYYEISTLMFFNFDNFFEKLILDNFKDLPFLNEYADKFHEIITSKRSFPTTKRPEFGNPNKFPGSNKYNNNPYQYPDNEKEFKRMFKDKDKFNKHIFVNKQGVLYPPPSNNDKDILFGNPKKKSRSTDKKEILYSFDSTRMEEVKAALELQSNKKGYTLGVKTYKPLGLFKEREYLRKLRDREKQEALGGNIILMGGEKRVLTEGDIEANQDRYEKNRKDNWKRILNDKQMKQDYIKERHNDINEKNLLSYNEKINAVKDRQDKYSKIFEDMKKNQELAQNEHYLENNKKLITAYKEPKCRFYDPVPSITTNKGFTFGRKYVSKRADKDIISPEFPTFQDDFEKLIEKNKKRVIVKPLGPKIPVNKSIQVGDSSKVMEKMKVFEKRRLDHLKETFNEFFEDRKYRKDFVIKKKKEIEAMQEQNLQEQIQKTYKNDDNYLIRDINYGQVESSSPSFSMKGRYEIGSIFQTDKVDKENDFSTSDNNFYLENPNFSLIRPRYPAFSFGNSQRFNSVSNEGRNERNKEKDFGEKNLTEGNLGTIYYYGDQDSHSFLKAQTTMGTGKKLYTKENGYPGPNQYLIRGFADEVKLRGDKVNETRKKLIEKKKLEDLERQRKAKLREERFEERRKALKMSLRDSIYGNTNINNNDNADKEMHLDENNENNNANDNNDEDNVDHDE